jgi:hypothetical protein
LRESRRIAPAANDNVLIIVTRRASCERNYHGNVPRFFYEFLIYARLLISNFVRKLEFHNLHNYSRALMWRAAIARASTFVVSSREFRGAFDPLIDTSRT